MLRTLLDWWANYSDLPIPADRCPVGPDGAIQTASAALAPEAWANACNIVFTITVVLVAVFVLGTYESRRVGNAFWRRWIVALPITALVAGTASYVFLSQRKLMTVLCENGNVPAAIPSEYVLGRASVALAQGVVLFFLFSVLLTLLARVWKRGVWYDKVKIPLPI
jgi:hypothetical protein